jgi:hypothetical protein
MLLLAVFGVAKAQVTIGDLETAGNDTYLPMNSLYEYSYSQQIYTADEIGTAGTINAITVWMYGAADLYTIPFDIYMVETDKESFTGTDWESVSSSDIVYSGSVTVHNTTAEAYTFTLNAPFQYSGQGNLMIAFDNNCGQWKGGLNGKVFTATDNVSRSMYVRRDSNDYDPTNMSGISGTTRAMRNVIEIDITPGGGPTCAKPTNFVVSYTGGSTATVTWEGEASLYNIDINGTVTEGVTSPYVMNVLPATTYTVKVQADCGGGLTSGWTGAQSFFTPCEAFDLPYAYGFEDANELNCWNMVYTANTPGIYNGLAYEGNNSFRFSSFSSASSYDQYLISPQLNTTNGVDVTFYYAGYSYGSETFKVGYSTTSNDPSAFTWGDQITATGTNWNLYEGSFPAGTKYVGVYYYSNYQYYLYVDDFTFEVPSSCRKPSDLNASVVGNRNATISWTENGEATAWIVEVTDLDGGQVTTWNANATTFEIVGLTPDTHYSVRVKPDCDVEKWSDPITFRTEVACPAPSVTVNNITPTTAEASWTGEASSYNLRYRPIEGSPMATVILTAGDVWGDGTGYQMLIDADATAYGSIIPETGGLTSSGDASAATYAEFEYKIPVNADGSMSTTNVVLSNSITIQIPAGTYDWCITNPTPGDRIWIASGNGNIPGRYDDYVFEAGNVYEFTVSIGGSNDQVNLTINGAKRAPRPVYAKAISRRSEMKNIANVMPSIHNYTKLPLQNPSRDEEEWTVVENVTSPYTMDVEPGTNYEVQVMAICGGEDGSSDWGASTYFETPTMCDAPTGLSATNVMTTSATLNWNGLQDGFEVRYRAVGSYEAIYEENFENGIPSTWTTIDADGDGNNWFALSEIGTLYPFYAELDLAEWAHGGSNSAVSASAYNNPESGYTALNSQDWLITPQLTLGGTLRFFVKSADSDWPDAYEVLLSTTGNATTDFTVALKEVTPASGDWTEVTIDLSDYAGTQGYIAIFHGTEDMYFLLVDDFGLYNEIENDWESTTTDALSATIEGLEPETEYEWQVRGENRDCGEDGFTEWSALSTFTTHGLCDNPTNLTFEADGTTVTLNWTGYQDSYDLTYYTPALGDLLIETGVGFNGYADWTEVTEDEETGFYALSDDYSYVGYGFSSTSTPQYLISPEFDALEGESFVEFMYYATGTEENPDIPETFKIGYSTTDAEVASFTWGELYTVSGTDYMDVDLPAGAKYFAIQYESDHAADSTLLFFLDFTVVSNYVAAGEHTTLAGVTSPVTIEGLDAETIYRWEVTGICGEESTTQTVYSYFMTGEAPSTITQTITLHEGWNWISLYVEVEDPIAMLQQLETALGDNATMISATEIYTEYLGDGLWIGDLDDEGVYNEQMYMIEAVADCEIELEGVLANAENYTIDINPGWNWIGFPHSEELLLEDALVNFPSEEEDQFAEAEAYSEYGFGMWIGDVETLVPGHGYMYFFNGEETTPLVYNTFAKARKAGLKAIEKKTDKVTFNRNSIKKMK